MDFEDIIGQDRIISRLKNVIKNDRINQSFLFEGPAYIGKKSLALSFAKTLLCNNKEKEACKSCSSCLKVESGNHPDLIIERAEGDSFKKKQIKTIQKMMRVLPYEGDKKIFILQNIDNMTQHAQNSFLKILEEPPEYAIIIMTVINSNSILPTIVSRCQRIKLLPVKNTEIQEYIIKKYNKTEKEARFISAFSNGIVGRAIYMCESKEFVNLREGVISLIDSVINHSEYKVFSEIDFFVQNKDKIEEIINIILMWFRDLIIYKKTNSQKFLINKDKNEKLYEHCKKIPSKKIYSIIETVKRTKNNINIKTNFELNMELMLLSMKGE